MDDFAEIQGLRRELTQAGYEYYVLDKPTMSDFDYDHKLRRLEELEAAHPETVTPDSPGGWVASPWTPSPRYATRCLWSPFRMCSIFRSWRPLTSG